MECNSPISRSVNSRLFTFDVEFQTCNQGPDKDTGSTTSVFGPSPSVFRTTPHCVCMCVYVGVCGWMSGWVCACVWGGMDEWVGMCVCVGGVWMSGSVCVCVGCVCG